MKLLSLSILLLFIVGCGHTPEKVPFPVPVFMPVVCEDYGYIPPVRTLPVVFVSGTDRAGFEILGLRGDQYSNLSINSTETIRYITEQKKAIGYYRKCITDHNVKQEKADRKSVV